MKCEFDFCIYNQAWACILDNIHINELGMCDDCILISLDENFLKEAKQTQLEAIEARWIAFDQK